MSRLPIPDCRLRAGVPAKQWIGCLLAALMLVGTATAAPPSVAESPEIRQIRMDLFDWARAWESRDIDRYMAFYHPAFRHGQRHYREWRERKAALFQRKGPISVTLTDFWIAHGPDTATVQFLQDYRDATTRDFGEKTLELEKLNGRWKIISETWRPLQLPPEDTAGASPATASRGTARPAPAPQAPADAAAAPSETSGPVTVDDLQVRKNTDGEGVAIWMRPYAVPTVFRLNGGKPRVVIDVRNVPDWSGPEQMPVDGRIVQRIRTHLHRKRNMLRIVLDLFLAEDVRIEHAADPDAGRYTVTVSPTG